MGSVGVRTDKGSRTARLVFCIQTIEGTLMKRFERLTGCPMGLSALLLVASIAGCGDSILGSAGGGGGGPGPAGAAPALGVASGFAGLAGGGAGSKTSCGGQRKSW